MAGAVGLGMRFGMVHTTVTDLVVLERRAAPALLLRLSDWLPVSRRTPYDVVTGSAVATWPGPPEEPSLSAAVRLSGVDALVAALGVPLSGAAGAGRVKQLREVLCRGRREVRGAVDAPPLLRGLAVGALAAVVVLLLPLIFGVFEPGARLVIVQVIGLLGAAVVAAKSVLLRQAARERDAVELPGPVRRPAPTVPTSRRFVERSLVSAGPEWLVVRDQHDREGWTLGPAQGGATTVRVTWPWLSFHDAADARLWLLKVDEWLAEAELPGWLAELRAAGYEVTGDAHPGPNDRWWFGVPVFTNIGPGQEPLGLVGQWADNAYVACALSVALQARLQLAEPGAGSVLVVPSALAVLAGLTGAVRARREKKDIWKARPAAHRVVVPPSRSIG